METTTDIKQSSLVIKSPLRPEYNTILSNEKKTDLVSTILERKRREIMIQKENPLAVGAL